MATKALAAAGRRVAGQSGIPALASCRRGGGGGAQSGSSRRSAHNQAAEDHDAVTAEQVEAALNSKNVEEEEVVLQEDQGPLRAATVRLPDKVVDDADAAWVPDQDTGVFVPAEEAAAGNNGAAPAPAAASSVLDQTVFVREEEMEDVERPAVDMANGGAN